MPTLSIKPIQNKHRTTKTDAITPPAGRKGLKFRISQNKIAA
jgi:hypothetical protein